MISTDQLEYYASIYAISYDQILELSKILNQEKHLLKALHDLDIIGYDNVYNKATEGYYSQFISVFNTRRKRGITDMNFRLLLKYYIERIKLYLLFRGYYAEIRKHIQEDSSHIQQELPKNLRPVLAKIHHSGDLGHSEWYEVVYYDEDIKQEWCCYAGSKTFKDGEKVIQCFKHSLKIKEICH